MSLMEMLLFGRKLFLHIVRWVHYNKMIRGTTHNNDNSNHNNNYNYNNLLLGIGHVVDDAYAV